MFYIPQKIAVELATALVRQRRIPYLIICLIRERKEEK
jgi:hypothetical protein